MKLTAIFFKDGYGWFRILGKGQYWKDINRHPLIFSEQYGFKKVFTIGKWRIGLLK